VVWLLALLREVANFGQRRSCYKFPIQVQVQDQVQEWGLKNQTQNSKAKAKIVN
jgi:hypothetical protein